MAWLQREKENAVKVVLANLSNAILSSPNADVRDMRIRAAFNRRFYQRDVPRAHSESAFTLRQRDRLDPLFDRVLVANMSIVYVFHLIPPW